MRGIGRGGESGGRVRWEVRSEVGCEADVGIIVTVGVSFSPWRSESVQPLGLRRGYSIGLVGSAEGGNGLQLHA